MTDDSQNGCPFRPAAPLPRPGRPSLWRIIRSVARADLEMYPRSAYRKSSLKARLPTRSMVVVNAPELTRKVLVEEQPNYPKADVMRRLLEPLIGQSMFISNGEVWRRQRRMVNPSLELGRLKALFPLMAGAIADMEPRLQAAAKEGVLDIDAETTCVTADIIARTMFSQGLSTGWTAELYQAFVAYQQTAPGMLLLEAAGVGYWLAPLRRQRMRRAAQRIRGLLRPMIAARMQAFADGTRPNDILTTLMEAQDPVDGSRFTLDELLDEVTFFFLAGHETSASGLAWTCYLLVNHPEAQERLRAEARAVMGDAPLAYEHAKQLTFARNVFREGLRLYPPVPFYLRETAEPCELAGRRLAPGALIMAAPWLIHRHEKIWNNPDGFDPDRFADPATKQAQRDGYMPFNVGPRVCPGAAFALQEGVLVLAAVFREWRLSPLPGHEPAVAARLTLRSRTGFRFRIAPARAENDTLGARLNGN